MIYWLTGNMASSTRLYYEVYHDPAFHVIVSPTPVRIPVAVGVFQEEITAVSGCCFMYIFWLNDM